MPLSLSFSCDGERLSGRLAVSRERERERVDIKACRGFGQGERESESQANVFWYSTQVS